VVHMSGILTMWYVELYVARKGLIFLLALHNYVRLGNLRGPIRQCLELQFYVGAGLFYEGPEMRNYRKVWPLSDFVVCLKNEVSYKGLVICW